MALFKNQFANVVEWEEFRDDMIFFKWNNREIKKGSRLIIRPGQDAIFLFNGKIEGIFKALARSLKMAVKRDIYHFELPSSKGML